ncbi:histone deacetylase 5 [Artemisia annua]|uniref:Histone deacetylase 5 n=1 Tax=Artemisia annua TaxID=35608 RepID=A0A2U1MX53_ARTAN|nr:histone deacetylase 5 [Artemisia annua]
MKFPPNDTSRNGTQSQQQEEKRRVGLVYDERMCKHATPKAKGESHPENPDRIRAVWDKLESVGITQRFTLISYLLLSHVIIVILTTHMP